jgi:hypothetical protein
MPDYEQLRDLCQNVSKISNAAIDEFLLYYAATRDKVDREFETRISRFRDTEREMPSNWKGLIKAQYIGHRIFKEGGLIQKYLNHAAIKERGAEEQKFLRKMADHPWRFSFSEISANPAPDFYEMEDVFTGEVYLLYSRSVSQILSEHPVLLWLNLIGFNGSCWQTYGPVASFQCFCPDDIFFYATEINPVVESEADLVEDLDDNPIRYMILAAGSNYPLIQSRGHEVVQVFGESNSTKFEVQVLKKEFRIEYAAPVFKLSHAVWSEPPHYAEVYYEEASGIVYLSALTDRSYLEMSNILNSYGISFPTGPDIRVHLPLLKVIEKVLKKHLEINPYARLFEAKASPESEAMMAKLNQFMALALPFVNSGTKPDVDALAKEAGVDPEIARDLLKKSMNKMREMRK